MQGRCIYGMHVVAEWIHARPADVRALHYDARAARSLAALLAAATAAGVAVEPCSDERLTTLAATPRHQGVVALAAPFPYADLDRVLGDPPRLLIIADQIQDPHNLGALLRTADAAGAGAVIIPKDGAVPVTATVEVAAAGAAAWIPVCRVTNIARSLQTLQECGYWNLGLVPRNGRNLYELDPPDRVAIVVGGETGVRPLVARQCDVTVHIPMIGRTESLNASVAAAIVIYELRRRWGDWQAAPKV